MKIMVYEVRPDEQADLEQQAALHGVELAVTDAVPTLENAALAAGCAGVSILGPGRIGAALLDAIVLAVVSREREGTYGYKITQDVRTAIDISESTLYPVLRRLQKEECLEVYDKAIDGRNRRYYKITEKGRAQLNLYQGEWMVYSKKITGILEVAV